MATRKTASRKVAQKPVAKSWWRRASEGRYMMPVLFILVFASLGSATLLFTHAASSAGAITGIASKCLDNDASKKVNGNKVQLYHCNGTGAQNWTVNTNGTIQNSNGYCLDVKGAGTAKMTLVQLYQCSPTDVAEQWKVDTTAKTIMNPHSGLCLDDKYSNTSDGNQIWIWTCNGTAAQKWTTPQPTAPTPTPTPTPTPGTPQPTGVGGSWKLAMDDEFNGSALDTSKWNIGWLSGPTNGVGSTSVTDSQQGGTYYGKSSVLFPGDGALHLRLQSPKDGGAPNGFGSRESGAITTAGLEAWSPSSTGSPATKNVIKGTSVIEIRSRLAGPIAKAGGYWPAFWMTNAGNYNGGGQGYSEEVDWLEGLDGNGARGSNLQFHLHGASEWNGSSVVPGNMQNSDFSTGYHTYTWYMSTNSVKVYLDGALVVSAPSNLVPAQWKDPQYLLLNFQATDNTGINTSATGSPNDLMIDYMRSWTQ